MNYLKQVIFISITFMLSISMAYSAIDEEHEKDNKNEVQRDPFGFLDFQFNTLSNIETIITNFGTIGLDRPNNRGTGYWPRGSRNQYIYGGGIWFGSVKKVLVPGSTDVPDTVERKLVSVSYDPNSGGSWMTPGRIDDGVIRVQDPQKYKVFFSTDFSQNSGEPLDGSGPNWPVWDDSENEADTLGFSRYFGHYIYEEDDRNVETYERGPAYISGEDIFSTFHDLDLSRYDGSPSQRRQSGYPLGLQIELTVYSWGFGKYQDFMFLKYSVINMSEDTLRDCWLAPIMDVDLARSPFLQSGASNDRVSYWFEDTLRNKAYQWTDGQFGEAGQGFGYLGFDFLESPSVHLPPLIDEETGDTVMTDTTYIHPVTGEEITDSLPVINQSHPEHGFVRKDSAYYHVTNQLGLNTFRNWSIEDDKTDDDERYEFIAANVTDGDTGPGDKRFMMATGPFHLRPKDTSRTVVCIEIASASKGGEVPDGTFEDRQNLDQLNEFAQEVYDNNFRAPAPPDQALFKNYRGLKNAVTITWDSTSEMSTDPEEDGMDFLGYSLQRARRPDLDTFNINEISQTDQYSRGLGPLGWKEIARWEIPKPFKQSVTKVDGVIGVDSLMVVGPATNSAGEITDTFALRVMKIGQGVIPYPSSVTRSFTGTYSPTIAGIDSTQKPWGKYFFELAEKNFDQSDFSNFQVQYDNNRSVQLFDTALVGIIRFDQARVPYNPLYYEHQTFEVSRSYKEEVLDTIAINGVAVIYETEEVEDPNNPDETIIVETNRIDSVYFVNTGSTLNGNYILKGALPIEDYHRAMRDSALVRAATDSIYSYYKQGLIKGSTFHDFEGSQSIKENIIEPFMRDTTNDRTFTDIGDDDRDGALNLTDDLIRSEKLINNTPYYYRLISYDQGDAKQPTPPKLNSSTEGRNQIETYPEAQQVGKELMFDIIEMDSSKLNGLYDFEFFAINEDRASQLFLGDTLELTMEPSWFRNVAVFNVLDQDDITVESGIYQRKTELRNISEDNKLLFSDDIRFNNAGCSPTASIQNLLSENAALRVGNPEEFIYEETGDTIKLGAWNNKNIISHTGTYSTGDFSVRNHCNTPNMLAPAYGTIGFRFKFGMQQLGGRIRPDSIYIEEGDANTYMTYRMNRGIEPNPEYTQTVQIVGFDTTGVRYDTTADRIVPRFAPEYTSFNNGPIDATIEFVGAGEETVTLEWNNNRKDPSTSNEADRKHAEFTVPYLEVRVTNEYGYSFTDSDGNKLTVNNEKEFEHLEIEPILGGDIVIGEGPFQITIPRKAYPDPRNLPALGIDSDEYFTKFNIASYGHVNVGINSGFANRPKSIARPYDSPLSEVPETFSGLQGRYYLTGYSDQGDTVDFVNILNIAGTQFIFDSRNIQRLYENKPSERVWPPAPESYTQGEDFEVGDKVRVKTFGGGAGLPEPGLKIKAVLRNGSEEGEKLVDDEMDNIKIVPNPFYIKHIDKQTPYQDKLYFTKVPPGSEIDIYTAHGQLIRSIKHDPFNPDTDNEGRVAVNVWDMLMKNGLRVQSQVLVAHITAPNGAETMKKFSVVVGTFNVYDE